MLLSYSYPSSSQSTPPSSFPASAITSVLSSGQVVLLKAEFKLRSEWWTIVMSNELGTGIHR
jgi:hypothetical protein